MIAAWLLAAAPAHAHRPGLSYARVGASEVAVTLSRTELASRPAGPSPHDLARALFERALVTSDGAPCELGDAVVLDVAGDGIETRASLVCPPGKAWVFTAPYLADLEPGHREYLEVSGQPVAVLDAGSPSARFDQVPGAWSIARRFIVLGVEHIWTGYDHLLFLLGLLLAARRLRDMLFVVTGFTIAHSVTLTLAALGYLALGPRIVEPAIALSIAWVGIENLFRPPARRRIVVTSLLGLVHGFGFAGQLAELGLPRAALVKALVSFNVGVELGQGAVVALALAVLLRLRKWEAFETHAVPAASVIVALVGMFWFVERVTGA
jgi:hydrogenase/urease accessory protein HupE